MERTRLGRREFGWWSATMALGAGAVSQAQGQEPAASPVSEADLLLAIAKQRWGSWLSEEQLKEIKDDLAGQLSRSARLSAFPLSNADEPAPVFAAYRGEG